MGAVPWLALMWAISRVAERNRSPFDFAEGESELVSGFNVEYGGALFAFFFIGEYASIILLRAIIGVYGWMPLMSRRSRSFRDSEGL